MKIQPAGRAAPLGHDFERQGFLPEMNSRSIRGQRDVQPVIDQNTRGGRTRFCNRKTRQFDKSARFEILLTNLNPACSQPQPRGEWNREASWSRESEAGRPVREIGWNARGRNARRSVT